jgi:hypothetical protein
MKYYFHLFLLSLLLLSGLVSSCGIMRKTKTVTVTETVTKIDTIIKIKQDSIPIIKTEKLTDTVFYENKFVRAKSYVNLQTHKITLQLQNKSFDVPVKMNESKKQTVTDVTKERKNVFWVYMSIFMFLILIILIVMKKVIQ